MSEQAQRTFEVDEVVVGWKPTESAGAALDWTLQRIDRLNCPLTLLVVFDPHKQVDEARRSEVQAAVDEVAQRVRVQHPSIEVRTQLVDGDPPQLLAERTGPRTLVVVGTDRRRGMSVKYAFSFGVRLAARAKGPVALIPHGELRQGKGVVVGVDGTPASIAAARVAARIALSRGGEELIVVHVWQEPTPWQDAYLPPDDAFLDSLQKVHQDVLDQSVAAFADDWPELVITKRLVHGLAPWGLLDQAADGSLLVVGNHGLRGIQRFFLGSVSHTIALNLEGPTLVVPQRPQ
ncbi:universal stress protein [Gryllotalpicola ginsengisoli]|uniref:universal stress protein n=1 Tax=Gryllotalpicola ginsengisoli TaxID=444608 RepID=UPI0003B71827|nr:universal stress protein [Gryllotalpicola ginsengisoli]